MPAAIAFKESAIAVQLRVIRALVLRDMRSRFGTGFVSYVVARWAWAFRP